MIWITYEVFLFAPTVCANLYNMCFRHFSAISTGRWIFCGNSIELFVERFTTIANVTQHNLAHSKKIPEPHWCSHRHLFRASHSIMENLQESVWKWWKWYIAHGFSLLTKNLEENFSLLPAPTIIIIIERCE